MTKLRKLIRAEISAAADGLGDDEVEVIMSTAALARDGHVLVPAGARLDNYRANPIVLWSHNSDIPLGNVEEIAVEGDMIRARVRFAPLGISAEADKYRGLVKAGVVRAVSVGFDPLAGEPIDPRKPKGGQCFAEWELWELSFCSVPVDSGALVTARAHGDTDMADKPTDTPTTPAPATRSATAPATRANRTAKVSFARGVYSISDLCSVFNQLGWQTEHAQWEAALEGDGSQVPAMLAAIMHDLGDAILAMAAEEIAEALANYPVDVEVEIENDNSLGAEERAHVRAAAMPLVRAFRYGMAQANIRAGKKLSAETAKCLREAKAQHEEAIGLHRQAIAKHKEGLASVDDMLERAGATDLANDDAGEEVDGERSAIAPQSNADFLRRQADLTALAAH